MRRLTVFHYHLLTGGITQVVTASLSALLSAAPSSIGGSTGSSGSERPISRIRLVCGVEENAGEVTQRIRSSLQARDPSEESTGGEQTVEVDYELLPELRYVSEMEEAPEPEELERILLERYGGDIWWVHNYHIGKNPPFTEALLRIAEKEPEQRMVLHIHDFPESGRFENLKLLYSQLGSGLYPLGPHIRYVVINGRDYSILEKAGIPEKQLFLLDNPVSPKPPDEKPFSTSQPPADAKTAAVIRDYCSVHATSWQEGGKLAIYPIRTIRRKNVLEAGFVARLLPRPVNLLVTLPGKSAQQIGYSDFVGECFDEGLIPGAWPVGTMLDDMGISFSQLTSAADLIMSSSIQEGFGYLFLNALEWKVPLLARDLDILEGMRGLFENYPACFYDSIHVPLSGKSRETLRSDYMERVVPIVAGVLPPEELKGIEVELEELCAGETVDFSFLSPALQKVALQRLENPSYRREVEQINESTLSSLARTMEERSSDKEQEIAGRFGPEAHAAQVEKILESAETAAPLPTISTETPPASDRPSPNGETDRGTGIHLAVRRHFTQAAYMRLLYF